MRLSRTFWMVVTVAAFAIMIWGFITLRNAGDAESRRSAVILSEEEAAYIPVEFTAARPVGQNLSISGTASPDSMVTLHTNSAPSQNSAGEHVLASAIAGSDGKWQAELAVSNTPDLSVGLMSVLPDGTSVRSVQTLYWIVAPQSAQDQVARVAIFVMEPGGATRVLRSPFGGLPQSGGLTLEAIDYDNAGGIIVAGVAPNETTIQIFANGALLAETGTGPDGRWRMVAGSTLPVGAYEIGISVLRENQEVAKFTVPFERFAPNSLPAYKRETGQLVGALFQEDMWQLSRALYGGGYQQSVIYAPLILVP